ncbi:MAG TPA: hypothetical protein DDW50_14820 [Firmicutes bacterium]|jgi:uncharacterized protein|nr:hypothetical protein [Bacillota bacterium]
MATSSGLGTGWAFPPRFYNNGKDVLLVSDEEDIKEALEVLISTALGERLNYSDFGCDMKQFMFEAVNRALVTEVQQVIADAIYNYESRITVEEIDVTESDEDDETLLITVTYTIPDTGSTDSVESTISVY